jgi:hypothetical protein
MALTTYTYSIQNDFPNHKISSDKLTSEINTSNISSVLLHINTEGDICEIFFLDSLSQQDETALNNLVAAHDGIFIPVNIMEVKLLDEYRDTSGKLRVHQTSRKLGTRICWTGSGDSPSNTDDVGNGEPITFHHSIGDSLSYSKYIDLNIANNETWIHEGYLTWKGAELDTITFELVPRTVSGTVSTGTNYNLYGGYLVVPAIPGTGTFNLTSDITSPNGGLVFIPNTDLGEHPTNAFWNADWNSTTKRYENISAAPTGNGRYNMFTVEVVFARFLNKIPLLENGFIAINSSDTDQLGNGMRLKLTTVTDTATVGDHEWSLASILCLHRAKSV